MRNKPAAHVKKGDTIFFNDRSGKLRSELVTKVTDCDYDNDRICIHFPPQYVNYSNGGKKEIQPKFSLVFNKNEQVYFERNKK